MIESSHEISLAGDHILDSVWCKNKNKKNPTKKPHKGSCLWAITFTWAHEKGRIILQFIWWSLKTFLCCPVQIRSAHTFYFWNCHQVLQIWPYAETTCKKHSKWVPFNSPYKADILFYFEKGQMSENYYSNCIFLLKYSNVLKIMYNGYRIPCPNWWHYRLITDLEKR